jgi:hypothetical protein
VTMPPHSHANPQRVSTHMNPHRPHPQNAPEPRGRTRANLRSPRCWATALAVLAAGGLSACGSSTAGLIPEENAGPLKGDFEAVAKAALAGDGNCGETDEALNKTEQDFAALPSSVNAGLRRTLQAGIVNLSERARQACKEPLASTTTTGASTSSTSTSTTTSTTTSTPTTTSSTTTSSTATLTPPTATTPGVGGGTQAPPGESGTPGNGQGNGQGSGGQGNGQGDGIGNNETGAGVGGAGAGAGK